MEVKLTEDDLLAAELVALEIGANRQPNLPPYVKGENCDVCGRGVPRWEFVRMGHATVCFCCEVPEDLIDAEFCVGRSQAGDIICGGCGTQMRAPTPQLRHCPNCWPEIWRAMDDPALTIMQLIAKLDAADAQREFWGAVR
jgi:hypothetical protein